MFSWWEKRRLKKTIASIRKHMFFLGYDFSEYTDDEIEKALVVLFYKVSNSGISLKEANKAMVKLASVL